MEQVVEEEMRRERSPSMQEIQKKMLDRELKDKDEENGMTGGAEYVRGQPELPKLQAWHPVNGPIDLNDWLSLVEPVMADLTATSQKWWDTLVKEARKWYEDHMKMSPMDRIHHDATPSKELEHPRWLRLERRASSTMLLQAVPEAQREELVSAKRLTALKVVCHLLMTYQPGGLAEKEVILSNLENPPEAVTVPEALQSLRRWARWRRRASELAVTEPDPYLLLKGLARIVKKPLEGNKELAFRVSLARNNLQVDSNPTARSVGALATHLTAELEQIAHLDPNTSMPKKLASPPREQSTQKVDVRLKKMEGRDSREAGGGSKGEGKGKDARSGETCRFFLTD